MKLLNRETLHMSVNINEIQTLQSKYFLLNIHVSWLHLGGCKSFLCYVCSLIFLSLWWAIKWTWEEDKFQYTIYGTKIDRENSLSIMHILLENFFENYFYTKKSLFWTRLYVWLYLMNQVTLHKHDMVSILNHTLYLGVKDSFLRRF